MHDEIVSRYLQLDLMVKHLTRYQTRPANQRQPQYHTVASFYRRISLKPQRDPFLFTFPSEDELNVNIEFHFLPSTDLFFFKYTSYKLCH